MGKPIFIVALEPINQQFPPRTPNEYILECELVEENDQGWLVNEEHTSEPVLYSSEFYVAFDIRLEALQHLEFAAKDIITNLEEQKANLGQFLCSVEVEIMKS